MKVTFWGTRGSIPTVTHQTQKYGGNTPCVSVEAEDTLLILDAGSGIRTLGDTNLHEAYANIHILLTHLHMDHVQGLGFFKGFFRPDLKISIWGPGGSLALKKRLDKYLSPPLFPVRIRDFACKLDLLETPMIPFKIGPFDIEASYVCHPGPTLGYRITYQGKSLAYIPDHEPALATRDFPSDPKWTSGFTVANGCDVLIHDGQFTDEEYARCMGWGHSSISHALAMAKMADIGALYLFHHDPSHSDKYLDELFDRYECARQSFNVEIAIEDTSFSL